jgi:hypothetical protein
VPADLSRLQALEDIGRTLRAVLVAANAPPGTIDHVEAWIAAERVIKALGELVSASAPLASLVAAVVRRISRPQSMA